MKRALWMAAILGAALALGPAPSVLARGQEHPMPPQEGEGRKKEAPKHPMLSEKFIEKLTEHLKLSGEQQAKVKAVLEKSRPEMEKLETEMRALHEKLQSSMRKAKEGIRETLDMDQKDKFDEMMQFFRRRMGGSQHPGGPEGWKGGRQGKSRMESRGRKGEKHGGEESETEEGEMKGGERPEGGQ